MPISTGVERADAVRRLLAEPGWIEVQDPTTAAKMDQAKDQMLLDPDDRLAEFKNWTIDKFAGFVIGLGWSRHVQRGWLERWDNEIKAYQAATTNPPAPSGFRTGGDLPSDPSINGSDSGTEIIGT